MILEFAQPFGKWKVGDITDEVSEGVGRALVEQGTAKPSTEMAQVRSTLQAAMPNAVIRSCSRRNAGALLQGGRKTTGGPPGVDLNVVQADHISAGEPVFEQGKKHLSPTSFVAFMPLALAVHPTKSWSTRLEPSAACV